MKSCRIAVCVAALTAFLLVPALHGVPPEMNYQGRLLNDSGEPVTSNVTVSVGIYTNDIGGGAVYGEDIGIVPVVDGVYAFRFGTNGLAIRQALQHANCWLELSINGSPLEPRQRLVAVPYALRSLEAENITSNTTFVAGSVTGQALANGSVSSNKMAAAAVGVPHLSRGVEDRFVNEDGDTIDWLDIKGGDSPGEFMFQVYAGPHRVAWAKKK